MARFGQRILSEARKVLSLKLMLKADPIAPNLIERLTEHMLEIARIEGLRILWPAEPIHGLVDAIGQCEIGKEAGPVEVGIGADLEIDLRALAFETQRREQPQMVVHFCAEHHLVIAALGAAEPARHPGFV